MQLNRSFLPITLLTLLCLAPDAFAEESQLWQRLKSGEHAVLMRHALAPGTGDPSGFDVNDCGTQRNLSEEGRKQAQRIGDRFRANGIRTAEVMSSQWCRCVDTAELLGLGPVQTLESLNSFFQQFERRDKQTVDLERWLRSQSLDRPLVLVTHQVNISALTGEITTSGEMVVVKVVGDAPIEVVGALQTE